MRKKSESAARELLETVLALKDVREAQEFFRDLLTEAEIAEFERRWKVIRMLDAGEPYSAITAETGASSTTVSRAQKWLTQGTGGFRKAVSRVKEAKQ